MRLLHSSLLHSRLFHSGRSRGAFALAVLLPLAACQPGGAPPGGSTVTAAPSAVPAAAPLAVASPRYSDALAGLYTQPATSVPLNVPVNYYAPQPKAGAARRAVLAMALVPGANYGRLRSYHAEAAKTAGPLAASDLQIQPVLLRAVDILKQRYAWLELTDDVATAQAQNDSLTLVLDIRSVLSDHAGDPTRVQLEVVVFDEQRKPVSRILAEGTAGADSGGYGFQAAAQRALEALDEKSKTYFN